jgi:hypothetical protein
VCVCVCVKDEWKAEDWGGILQAQEAGDEQHYHHLRIGPQTHLDLGKCRIVMQCQTLSFKMILSFSRLDPR